VLNGIVQTTNFSDPALDVNNYCTAGRTGKAGSIGNATDVRVIGAGTATSPTTTMLTVVKMNTLKFYGITSRNAAAFNVCLGALNLEGNTTVRWTGIDKQAKPILSTPGTDADGLPRQWAMVGDCTAKFIDKTKDPCVVLKTKSASALATQMTKTTGTTWTVAMVNSQLNFFDGDIAILQNHPWPWDGKTAPAL
jgi:hypothetical protein